MSVAQMRELPWWERRLLDEGLIEEFRDPDAPDVTGNEAADLMALGLTVETPS